MPGTHGRGGVGRDGKINRRLAAKHGQRVQGLCAAQFNVRQLRFGGVQLRRGLRDIEIGNDAAARAGFASAPASGDTLQLCWRPDVYSSSKVRALK